MTRKNLLILLCLVLGFLSGCGSKNEDIRSSSGAPSGTPVRQDIRIKVVDVSNKTGELFDVDAIGMLWSGLDEALKNKGLLWSPGFAGTVLSMRAEIVDYRKGNLAMRTLLPFMGKTVLEVRCNLTEGGRVVATAEARRSLSVGSGGFTVGAWRKVFGYVSQELVDQLAGKI